MKRLITLSLLLLTFSIAFAQDKPEGLFINSKAYDFKAKDQNGKEIALKDIRKKGPVVIMFYRGYWCPYCNKELQHFQDSLQYITDKGAQLIAVTPEAAEGIAQTVTKTGATFPIVYDEDMKIAKAYGVAFKVEDNVLRRYKNSGIDLLANNHQKDEAYLPVPAVYIINKEGSVTYRYFDANYRNRVSVKELLRNIQ